jgi:hypothetical protein
MLARGDRYRAWRKEISMRIAFAGLALIYVLFAVVQYNDPDIYFWAPVYLVPAIWSGMAAFRPLLLSRPWAMPGVTLCLGLAVAGTFYFWPSEAGFWKRDVWWESETAREGMGMMIVTFGLAATALATLKAGRAPAE